MREVVVMGAGMFLKGGGARVREKGESVGKYLSEAKLCRCIYLCGAHVLI